MERSEFGVPAGRCGWRREERKAKGVRRGGGGGGWKGMLYVGSTIAGLGVVSVCVWSSGRGLSSRLDKLCLLVQGTAEGWRRSISVWLGEMI